MNKEELNDDWSGVDWNATFGPLAYPHGSVIACALSNTLSRYGSPGAIGGYPVVVREITIEEEWASGISECRHIIFLLFSEVSNGMKLIARANA
jgi:hypothetical protein